MRQVVDRYPYVRAERWVGQGCRYEVAYPLTVGLGRRPQMGQYRLSRPWVWRSQDQLRCRSGPVLIDPGPQHGPEETELVGPNGAGGEQDRDADQERHGASPCRISLWSRRVGHGHQVASKP